MCTKLQKFYRTSLLYIVFKLRDIEHIIISYYTQTYKNIQLKPNLIYFSISDIMHTYYTYNHTKKSIHEYRFYNNNHKYKFNLRT